MVNPTADKTTGVYTGHYDEDNPSMPANSERVEETGLVDVINQVYDFTNQEWVFDLSKLADYKVEQTIVLNDECKRQVFEVAGWTIEKQVSFANGIYSNEAERDQMSADTLAAIEASNVAQDAIDAAVDFAGVDAAVNGVVWPTFPAPLP